MNQIALEVPSGACLLAARDLTWPVRTLEAAAETLDALGDRANALHARLSGARRQLLVGELEATAQTLAAVQVAAAAVAAGIPALAAEVGRVSRALLAPSARLIRTGVARLVRLDEIEVLFASGDLIVDGCWRTVRSPAGSVLLAGRPVLFNLVSALAEAWPADLHRDELIKRAFHARNPNASHGARLRVELGRLRAALRELARVEATPRGFALAPIKTPAVVVLASPVDGPAGSILALLESGEAWSTSALASALGSNQRTVQRTFGSLRALP